MIILINRLFVFMGLGDLGKKVAFAYMIIIFVFCQFLVIIKLKAIELREL